MRDFLWFCFYFLTLILTFVCFTINHETAHKAICEEFGGNATINYFEKIDGLLLISTTTCRFSGNLSALSYQAYQIADSSGEWTYVVEAVLLAIFSHAFLMKII